MKPTYTDIYRRWLASAAFALGRLCAIRPRTVAEGVAVCLDLACYQTRSTLGKFSTLRDQPSKIVEEYCLASRSVSAAGVDPSSFYLSIKPPALAFDARWGWDITATALGNGHGIHVDSHGHDLALPTFDFVDQLVRRSSQPANAGRNWRFGVTLASRWKRSRYDAEWASERGLRVRIVKGEFKARDPLDEVDARTGFLALVDMLAGKAPALALATHDVGLAREAIARSKNSGSSIELELLYRFPADRMIALARELDFPIRFYVPYGRELFVYAARHLLTNPRKLARGNYLRSWLARRPTDLYRLNSPIDRPIEQ